MLGEVRMEKKIKLVYGFRCTPKLTRPLKVYQVPHTVTKEFVNPYQDS